MKFLNESFIASLNLFQNLMILINPFRIHILIISFYIPTVVQDWEQLKMHSLHRNIYKSCYKKNWNVIIKCLYFNLIVEGGVNIIILEEKLRVLRKLLDKK